MILTGSPSFSTDAEGRPSPTSARRRRGRPHCDEALPTGRASSRRRPRGARPSGSGLLVDGPPLLGGVVELQPGAGVGIPLDVGVAGGVPLGLGAAGRRGGSRFGRGRRRDRLGRRGRVGAAAGAAMPAAGAP